MKQAEKQLNEIGNYVQKNSIVPIADVEEKILPFIRETAKRYNLYQVFSELKEQGDYWYKQSIGVAVMAAALGKRLGMDNNELALLTIAASLYNIGMVKLPSIMISKPDSYTKEEYVTMQQHTVLGYDLLMNSDVDPRVALVALQHHEREDGSGYPNGLTGEQIDPLSKIVSIVDVYIAMISNRPYRPSLSFFEIVDQIHQQIMLNRFDSVIGHTFLDMLLSTQIGCDVVLSDDRRGKILLSNVNYPTKPFVVLENRKFIDLSKSNDITIKEVIG